MLFSNRLGAMAVLHNYHEYGPSDLLVQDGIVKEYDKKQLPSRVGVGQLRSLRAEDVRP